MGDVIKGKVKNLKPSFGFVKLDDGRDAFFLPRSVHGRRFEELTEGQDVEVEVEEAPRGLRATTVEVL